jgi:hypothetical protein
MIVRVALGEGGQAKRNAYTTHAVRSPGDC